MSHFETDILLKHWSRLPKPAGQAPLKTHLDLEALKSLMPRLIMLGHTDLGLRIRLMGEDLILCFGASRQNIMFDSLFHSDQAGALRAAIRLGHARICPVEILAHFQGETANRQATRMVFVPLSGSSGPPDRWLGVISLEPEFPIATTRLPFRLDSARLILTQFPHVSSSASSRADLQSLHRNKAGHIRLAAINGQRVI